MDINLVQNEKCVINAYIDMYIFIEDYLSRLMTEGKNVVETKGSVDQYSL